MSRSLFGTLSTGAALQFTNATTKSQPPVATKSNPVLMDSEFDNILGTLNNLANSLDHLSFGDQVKSDGKNSALPSEKYPPQDKLGLATPPASPPNDFGLAGASPTRIAPVTASIGIDNQPAPGSNQSVRRPLGPASSNPELLQKLAVRSTAVPSSLGVVSTHDPVRRSHSTDLAPPPILCAKPRKPASDQVTDSNSKDGPLPHPAATSSAALILPPPPPPTVGFSATATPPATVEGGSSRIKSAWSPTKSSTVRASIAIPPPARDSSPAKTHQYAKESMMIPPPIPSGVPPVITSAAAFSSTVPNALPPPPAANASTWSHTKQPHVARHSMAIPPPPTTGHTLPVNRSSSFHKSKPPLTNAFVVNSLPSPASLPSPPVVSFLPPSKPTGALLPTVLPPPPPC